MDEEEEEENNTDEAEEEESHMKEVEEEESLMEADEDEEYHMNETEEDRLHMDDSEDEGSYHDTEEHSNQNEEGITEMEYTEETTDKDNDSGNKEQESINGKQYDRTYNEMLATNHKQISQSAAVGNEPPTPPREGGEG